MFHSLVSVGPVFFVLSSALSIGADTVKIASIFAKSGPAEISNLCHIRDDLAATKDFEGVSESTISIGTVIRPREY